MTDAKTLKQLSEAATQGKWTYYDCTCGHTFCTDAKLSIATSGGISRDDAELVAALINGYRDGTVIHVDDAGWQDISTAPKDGSSIIVWGQPEKHPGLEVVFNAPHQFTAYWATIDESFVVSGGDWRGPFIKPTYWRPLHTPPAQETE